MSIYYLPKVRHASEHAALQSVIRGYSDCPYDEWRHHQAEKIADLLAAKHKVRLVDVTAAEFADYCSRTGADSDIHTFSGFLWDRGKRLGAHRA